MVQGAGGCAGGMYFASKIANGHAGGGGRKAKENGAGMENKKRWDEKGEGTSESRKETDWGSLPKESNENMKKLEKLGRKGQRDRVR